MDLESLKIDRKPAPAGRRRARVPLSVVGLAVLAALVWLFWTPLSGLLDRIRLPEVRTFLVRESSAASVGAVRGTAANGYIVAARRAALSSDVPGRIVEMRVEEGSVVDKGDIVARLYSDEVAAALARAEADLKVAEAAVQRATAARQSAVADRSGKEQNLQSAQALLDEALAAERLARIEYDRVAELVAREISSRAELDSRKADLDRASARALSMKALMQVARSAAENAALQVEVAEGDLAVAKAQVDAARATVEQARATLEKMNVRAPFDGIVVLKDAEVGEVVSPNSQGGSNARGSVCTMVDFDSLEVQVDLPETALASVRPGAPAQVFLDAYPDSAYPGRVDRIWPTANRQKATVEVRVELLQKDGRLRPDMGVRVVFGDGAAAGAPAEAAAGTAAGPAILVPEAAIVEVGGEAGAFVVERDVVRFQSLSLGERKSGRVTVESGLHPGQRIVLDPPPRLQSGDRVRIQEG